MKRFLCFIFLALLMAASGCGTGGKEPSLPDRETLLPESLVSELAGMPMTLVYDRLDAESGFACWAWQETEGMPRLLVVELRFPPADCDGLYELAQDGAEMLAAPDGTRACYDGRAAHLRAGVFYIRISALGFPAEADALRSVVEALALAAGTN